MTPPTSKKSLPGVRGGPSRSRKVIAILSVEEDVRSTLSGAAEVTPAHRALVAVALTLARKLDEDAGMATAAVARELRLTLDAILGGPDDDDDGFAAFVDGLRAPMGDSTLS